MTVCARPIPTIWRALAALAGASLARAESAFAPTQVSGDVGSATAIAHWQIQSSAKAQQGGAEVSSGGFSTRDWYAVSGRATVMAGLLENGTYKNVFYSDNLRAAEEPDSSGNVFLIPWWYRSEFTLAEGGRETRTLLRINGMIASADVWLNGNLVAEQAAVAGAYPVHELDVTRWVHAGMQHPRIARASGRSEVEPVDWLGRLEPNATGQQHGPVAGRGYRAQRTGRDTFSAGDIDAVASRSLSRRADRESAGAKPRCVGARRNDHGRRGRRFAQANDTPRSRSDADRVIFPQERSGPRS